MPAGASDRQTTPPGVVWLTQDPPEARTAPEELTSEG